MFTLVDKAEDDTRKNFPHYHKNIEHLTYLDVYRILSLFNVTNPAIQHAIKKLLVPGRRGAKDLERDLREAIVSINRALQMIAEDQLQRMGEAPPHPQTVQVLSPLEVQIPPVPQRRWLVSYGLMKGPKLGEFLVTAFNKTEALFVAYGDISKTTELNTASLNYEVQELPEEFQFDSRGYLHVDALGVDGVNDALRLRVSDAKRGPSWKERT